MEKGSKLIRAKCVYDGDGMELFSEGAERRMELYRKIDILLACVTNGAFRFMNELNALQSNDVGCTVFALKTDIPLKVVNLVLAPYNIVVEEH